MKASRTSKAVAKSRKSSSPATNLKPCRAPAWAHTIKDRLLEALDGRSAAMPPSNVSPAHKLLAAGYADVSMAVLQFTIMNRIEDPRGAAVMARLNRDLFLTHKPVRLFRKRAAKAKVKPH